MTVAVTSALVVKMRFAWRNIAYKKGIPYSTLHLKAREKRYVQRLLYSVGALLLQCYATLNLLCLSITD